MTSSTAALEISSGERGQLPDGRAWQTIAGGYRCHSSGENYFQIEYTPGQETARFILLSGDNQLAELDLWFDWFFSLNAALQAIDIAEEGTVVSRVSRSGFYQRTELWYCGNNGGKFPLQWVVNEQGVRHPLRAEPPKGEVYRRHFHSLGVDFSLRHLDPQEDLERFTDWMNQERVALFWEEEGDAEKQRQFIDSVMQDPHKHPLIACFDDEPFAYFEIYWALEDRIAPYYDCQPFDRGAHMLVGNQRFLGGRFAQAWFNGVSHFMFLDDARTESLVGEPRADNRALLKYINGTFGWKKIKEFDFPHKRAALVMCKRDEFFRSMGGV
ncbi:GNAT family N-acetyltransferase [Microbulbifer sp. THAF38]|uniref:GNAT family N-acetyltransferase n=1 Tax=Microbulbifer sp. THAF38 TaxID=2587856 RepID=UPI0012680011|nr:GNAT family N-acetyltransferase [Microbulbifer sp. THAF38]QFT56125.1 N(6)-hydroxylysine O-acetyltransferase [Microbulbifer sp. THAF38]